MRGATQLDEDVRDHMLERVTEMVSDVMEANGLEVDDFISVIFTATSDLHSEFPAYAARRLGFGEVPLICARELEIDGSMPRVVRMMAHVETDLPRADITHVYLHGAAALRRDLTRCERSPTMSEAAPVLTGPVEVVGTGLLGTSIGLACRRAGIEVLLTDVASEHLRTASGLGAGWPRRAGTGRSSSWSPYPPTTSVPRSCAPSRTGTPWSPTSAASRRGRWRPSPAARGAERYVGSHPMAGSERSGPLAASAALFDGRPWAVTPHRGSDPGAVAVVDALVALCGAVPSGSRRRSTTGRSPAPRTSRTCSPRSSPPDSRRRRRDTWRSLVQGVRDVTRVAAGDPVLYNQIVTANSRPCSPCSARCAPSWTPSSTGLHGRPGQPGGAPA